MYNKILSLRVHQSVHDINVASNAGYAKFSSAIINSPLKYMYALNNPWMRLGIDPDEEITVRLLAQKCKTLDSAVRDSDGDYIEVLKLINQLDELIEQSDFEAYDQSYNTYKTRNHLIHIKLSAMNLKMKLFFRHGFGDKSEIKDSFIGVMQKELLSNSTDAKCYSNEMAIYLALLMPLYPKEISSLIRNYYDSLEGNITYESMVFLNRLLDKLHIYYDVFSPEIDQDTKSLWKAIRVANRLDNGISYPMDFSERLFDYLKILEPVFRLSSEGQDASLNYDYLLTPLIEQIVLVP